MPTLSNAQAQAVYTLDRNLMVMAGAGSGKTFVLVEHFLNVLYERFVIAPETDWRLNSLVAITFTREASLEMRNRVRTQMLSRSQQTNNPQERLRWAELLSQMDSARISTIDSLCADILRQNAAEANIDPSFTMLEEIDARLLRQHIVGELVQEFMRDEAWLAFFEQYKASQIMDTLSSEAVMRWELADADETLEVFDWREYFLAYLTYYHDTLASAWSVIQHSPKSEYQSDKLYEPYQQFVRYLPQLISNDPAQALEAFNQLLATKLGNAGNVKIWGDIKATLKSVAEVLQTIHSAMGEATHEAMKRRWVTLIHHMQRAYAQAKQRLNAYDFGDLERKTLELLRTYPSVRNRYRGAEFKHIMVDEFQDTNLSQWQIVQYLADVTVGGSVFIVGDAKQSIYGFRNADVSVFKQVQQELEANGTGLTVLLEDSYRTRPPLIELLNETFDHLLGISDPQERIGKYQVAMQRMTATRAPLPAEIDAHFAPLEMLALSRGFIPEDIKLDKVNRMWEAHEIAQRIQAMVGHAIVGTRDGTPRPMQYNDVMILFRALTNVKLYEDALDTLGIPFVTVAGRGFYNRQEVWDVLNALRVMFNPYDEIALMAVLRSPLFGLSENGLLALRHHDTSSSIWDNLQATTMQPLVGMSAKDTQQAVFAWGVLSSLRDLAGRVTIAELLRLLLSKTGYLAMLTGLRGGTRLRRNVEKLIDIAQDNNRLTLSAFIRYVDDLSDAEVREGEAPQDATGAVRLMSIHASKGLESPLVIVADVSNTGRRGGMNDVVMWDEEWGFSCQVANPLDEEPFKSEPYKASKDFQTAREETESWRLLYVAATRAQDYLVFSGGFKLNERGDKISSNVSGKWMQKLSELYELVPRYSQTISWDEPFKILPFRIVFPPFDARILDKARNDGGGRNAWELPLPTGFDGVVPALLAKPHIVSDGALQHISATQLAYLGGYRHAHHLRDYYRRVVAMSVVDDAPARISEAVRLQVPRVTRRIVGQIVHEALRHWQFPEKLSSEHFDNILKSYAWRFELTDENDVQQAVNFAKRILEGFKTSDMYQWIEEARARNLPVYPELPFIYKTEKRILHGVMDLLFQNTRGEWVIVDFKTGYLENNTPQSAQVHTRQFYLQVGAYAEAVREQLGGITPKAYIHYITYNQTVEIIPSAWQNELKELEPLIGEIVGELYA
jgi:ATP-dependent helicase/nuclease subunit A